MRRPLFIIALVLAWMGLNVSTRAASSGTSYVVPSTGGGGGGGGAPNTTIVSPGVNMTAVSLVNDSTYILGKGTYIPGTPSILNSNLSAGNSFTGWVIANKTNINFICLPYQTIFDGSGSLGELLWMTNCSGIYFEGGVFKGYTNHNYMALPGYSDPGSPLWASVSIYQCEKVTFYKTGLQGSTDHGLMDKAAENSGFVASSVPSTNQMLLDSCWADDIGGWRTNRTVGYVSYDGTAFGPTAWTLRNLTITRSLRGIEPYDDSTGGRRFTGTVIEGCTLRDIADIGILFAGSTNGHSIVIRNNDLENSASWSWRGTNFGKTTPNEHGGYGIMLNGGRGVRVTGNRVAGTWYAGAFIGNSGSFCDDFEFSGNLIEDIDSGDDDFGTGLFVGTLGTSAADASSVRRLNCSNNRFKNIQIRGIYAGRGRDNTFENNFFIDAGVYPNVGTLFASMVVGESGVTGITNCFVRNNTFVSTLGYVAYGLAIENNCVNVVNENNHFSGFVVNGGITNRSGMNVKTLGIPITGTATWDLPSIAANAQYQTNVALVGATTNAMFEVHFPLTALQGVASNLTARGWGSNGTLYAVFRNTSGAAVDAPSTTYELFGRDYRVAGQ